MATRADIEIAVKGIRKINQAKRSIGTLSTDINNLNKAASKDIFGKVRQGFQGLVLSANNLNKLLNKSQANFDKAAQGTTEFKKATDQLAEVQLEQARIQKINDRALANAIRKKKGMQTVEEREAQLDRRAIKLKELRAKKERELGLAEQARQRNAAIRGVAGGVGKSVSSAAISGAFPLLFGQGPAAAAGGFAGGLIGSAFGPMGGFAGGLVGTSSVTIFQEQVLGLANALDPLNADIDTAIEKLKGLSRARKEEIKIIEEFRGKQAALEEITKDLTKVVGADGVEAFRKLRESAKLFTDKFVDFALKLSANAAKLVNNAKEFINPGGFDFAQAQAGLESIDDPTIKDLNKKLDELTKKLENLPQVNLGEALLGSFFIRTPSASKKVSDQGAVKDDIKDVKNEIKLTAAKKAGAIIEKEAGAELRNQEFRIKEQLKQEQRLNQIRTEGRFVISKGLAEEILALEKINKDKIGIFKKEKDIAQKTIDQLAGRKDLSIEDQARLERAQATVTSIDAQVTANEKNFEALKKNTLESRKLQNAANETVDAFEKLNITIQNDIKQGIAGLIKGTSTLGDLLNNVADRFLDIALNQALFGNAGGKTVTGGLFSLFGFANGGRPPVGRPSIVGEKGPELFVPRSSGTIVPNNKLGGGGSTSVVVNVDASGSDVQGDNAGAKELGTLISVAVQGELLKQQRPGGLLSSLR